MLNEFNNIIKAQTEQKNEFEDNSKKRLNIQFFSSSNMETVAMCRLSQSCKFLIIKTSNVRKE